MLCQGYQREVNARMVNRAENATAAIPGLVSTSSNSHVASIKSDPWPQILLLMGKEGEKIMVDLILDCGLFVEVGSGCEIYHQLCGEVGIKMLS
jgi:telomerase reverse transcriptase